jgi:hypothetical protein
VRRENTADVPYAIRGIVPGTPAHVFKRHLDEHVPRDSGGFIKDVARMPDMLDNVAQNGDVKSAIPIRDAIPIEESTFH